MDLPPLTNKKGRAYNHINPDEYHSLYEWEEGDKDDESEHEDAAEEKDPLHGRDYEGEVFFFNNVGDCGFIESEDVANDAFFDLTEIDSIEQGVNVAFDIEQYEKGPMARSVIILDDE